MTLLLRFVLLFTLLSTQLPGQTGSCTPTIRLNNVEVERSAGYVGLDVLARGADCGSVEELQASDLRVTERISNGPEQEVEVIRITPRERYDTLDVARERVEIRFLVDVSPMADLASSKRLIEEFVRTYGGIDASYSLRTFADQVGEEVSFTPGELTEVLEGITTRSDSAHLYGALITALREQVLSTEPQFLFVLSSGENYPPDYGNLPRLAPRKSDVYNAAVTGNTSIFTIAMAIQDTGGVAGAGELLQDLPGRTAVSGAGYARGALPAGVREVFGGGRRLRATHLVEVRSTNPVFSGEQRYYAVTDLANPATEPTYAAIRRGSFTDRFRLGKVERGSDWLVATLVGLLGVGSLLALFYFAIPLLRRERFERQYVVAYAPQPGRRLLDPLTREPVAAGEAVVNVCAVEVPLQTWRDCGGQCPHYPGCTSNTLQCDGAGRGESLDFFALNGVNRRLNWIWFGAVGGFLGWVLYALIVGLGSTTVASLAAGLLPDYLNGETLVRDTLLGGCFGLGITALLSIMEERSQSRRLSWTRIGLRALIGAVTATVAFGLGLWLLERGGALRPVIASAISWILFGLGLGFVLSFRSSIDRQRGLLGGLLAGVAGFFVYWMFGALLGDAGIPKVLSLLVAGGLLGYILDTVVVLAEEYEMEYLTPVNYRRTVPLSKWLKNEWNIIIGTQPGSQIYVKWPDEDVLPEHAQLKLEGGRVYLIPQGETLVNGRIVNEQKRVQLENGDTLQLGRRGVTQMRFWTR